MGVSRGSWGDFWGSQPVPPPPPQLAQLESELRNVLEAEELMRKML